MQASEWTRPEAYECEPLGFERLVMNEGGRRLYRAFETVANALESVRTDWTGRVPEKIDIALDSMTAATAVHEMLRGTLAAKAPKPLVTLLDELARALSLASGVAGPPIEVEIQEDLMMAHLDPEPAWVVAAAVVEMVESQTRGPLVVRAMLRRQHVVLSVSMPVESSVEAAIVPSAMLQQLARKVKGSAAQLGSASVGIVIPASMAPLAREYPF